jgi:predicted nucleic acid-binding protein
VSERELIVLDASVGVKWLKPEAGSDTARSILANHRDGRVRVVVPAHFMHELVGVAVRHGGPDLGEQVWETLRLAGLTSVTLDDELASAAFDQCRSLGCSFYDALAPAFAQLLGAVLYSADAKAHAGFPGVRLVG